MTRLLCDVLDVALCLVLCRNVYTFSMNERAGMIWGTMDGKQRSGAREPEMAQPDVPRIASIRVPLPGTFLSGSSRLGRERLHTA